MSTGFKAFVAGAGLALAIGSAAGAAPWVSINARQASLEQRINAGVRDGSLTRAEAQRLRTEFVQLKGVEAVYRRNGLTAGERAVLDRRFNALSSRIYNNRHDAQARGWQSIARREGALTARIDAGVRGGGLTRVEAVRLRSELRGLITLERSYSRNGLTAAERAVLDRRFDGLSNRIYANRHDRQRR
jgi:hypothetical protein